MRYARRRMRMGQVTITLNGRSYRLTCGDGEEARLLQLAAHVETRLNKLMSEFGQVGDERLLVMTSLMVADELFDAQTTIGELRQIADGRSPPAVVAAADHPPIAAPIALPPQANHPADDAPHIDTNDSEPEAADMPPEPPSVPVQPEPMLKRAIQQQRAEGRLSLEQRLADARSAPPVKASDRKSGNG